METTKEGWEEEQPVTEVGSKDHGENILSEASRDSILDLSFPVPAIDPNISNQSPMASTSSNKSSCDHVYHPFNTFQQYQLHAQIFVYGSLLEGVLPRESMMMIAFAPESSSHLSDYDICQWHPSWKRAGKKLKVKDLNVHTGNNNTSGIVSSSLNETERGKKSAMRSHITDNPDVMTKDPIHEDTQLASPSNTAEIKGSKTERKLSCSDIVLAAAASVAKAAAAAADIAYKASLQANLIAQEAKNRHNATAIIATSMDSSDVKTSSSYTMGGKMLTSIEEEAAKSDHVSVIKEEESTEVEISSDSEDVIKGVKVKKLKKGSHVEIAYDQDGFQDIWTTGRVLHVDNGKALVNYNTSSIDKDPIPYKAWFSLEEESVRGPRIRVLESLNKRSKVPTKRKREAMNTTEWHVGEHVDVWFQKRWIAAVVSEKNKETETEITIRFKGKEDTLQTKVWNLRPTLVWSNGKWLDWRLTKVKEVFKDDVEFPALKKKRMENKENYSERKNDTLPKVTKLKEEVKPKNERLAPLRHLKYSAGKKPKEESAKDKRARYGKQNIPRKVQGSVGARTPGFAKSKSEGSSKETVQGPIKTPLRGHVKATNQKKPTTAKGPCPTK